MNPLIWGFVLLCSLGWLSHARYLTFTRVRLFKDGVQHEAGGIDIDLVPRLEDHMLDFSNLTPRESSASSHDSNHQNAISQVSKSNHSSSRAKNTKLAQDASQQSQVPQTSTA